jgi:predicted lipoprotein
MNARAARRAGRVAVAMGLVAAALAIVRPWTVVPIQSTPAETFDPHQYVTSIWDSRVLPTALQSAIDLQTFMTTPGGAAAAGSAPRAVFVKGTATVSDVDRKSRIGVARLRLPWTADAQHAAIQIGPVLRGTALRDALEFIRFTDFVNQLEFAGVANALNDRVATGVLAGVNVDDLAGRAVTFVGAVPASGARAALEIVPVQLMVVGGAP